MFNRATFVWAFALVILIGVPLMAQQPSSPAAGAANAAQQPSSQTGDNTNTAQQPPSQPGDNTAQRGGGRYDQQILQEVTQKLQKYDWAKDIRVSVEDGIVTLQGTVPLYLDKELAYQKVHNMDHVQGVRNLIVVKGPDVPDDKLRSELADKLRYDRVGMGNTFNNFALDVHNGVVTIAGQARTPTDAQSALAIVESTPGVKDVRDEIQVLPTSGFDDDIRLAVARAIYGSPELQKYALDPQRPIRIVVDHGHVTLYGVVDSQMDKQLAEMKARSVPNVFSVTNDLVVANQKAK